MIEKIDDIKTAKEMESYSDIYEWARDKAAENEAYWGTDLSVEKNEKLTRMREIAIKIADKDKGIKHSYVPFDNSNRNATIQLDFPAVFFTADEGLFKMLGALMDEADDFCMSSLGEGIRMTFGVHNMWNNNGTIYDKEKTK